ncbi:MAG: tetratricopeptide repeat protein [Acidobacteriaceae bacterium]|jgi:TolA-binding protein
MTKHLISKRVAVSVALALALAAPPAFAVNKDMVQLQTQIQQLQDAVARLQQSNDERMGVLKDLVQQSADSVNKMSLTVEGLQQQMKSQQEASNGKLDQVSGQVQSLNDSLDEVKARLNNLEKALQSVQNQQQSINAALQNMTPAPSGAASPDATPGAAPPASAPLGPGVSSDSLRPAAQVAESPKPGADIPFATTQGPPILPRKASVASAPPVGDLYQTALKDWVSAKYPLASSEFNAVIRNYPDDPLAGNSYYYLGEIDYRAGKYSAAIKDYDHVLDGFPDSVKTAVAHLHKGQALIAVKETDAGIREFRTLIQRFPNSAEAGLARSRLNGMGVSVFPKPPA